MHRLDFYSPSATDLHYELMCLWAVEQERRPGDSSVVHKDSAAALLQVSVTQKCDSGGQCDSEDLNDGLSSSTGFVLKQIMITATPATSPRRLHTAPTRSTRALPGT